MTQQEEQRLKNQFIADNPNAENGLKAALMFNPLYLNNENRRAIQTEWIAKMEELAVKYANVQTLDVFLLDLCELKSHMNGSYGTSFRAGGFKFSHAQKSFSVFLKYRWCQGLIATPPSCPIDRGVLYRLGRPYSTWSWTKIEECKYSPIYVKLQREAQAASLSVAQMELQWFGH